MIRPSKLDKVALKTGITCLFVLSHALSQTGKTAEKPSTGAPTTPRTAPTSTPSAPSSPMIQTPVDCYTKAREKTVLSERQALTLCQCALSARPVDCYLDGKKTTTLSDQQLLELCVGTTTYPRDCFLQYYYVAPPTTR